LKFNAADSCFARSCVGMSFAKGLSPPAGFGLESGRKPRFRTSTVVRFICVKSDNLCWAGHRWVAVTIGCAVKSLCGTVSHGARRSGSQTNQKKANKWQHPVGGGSAETGCSSRSSSNQTFYRGTVAVPPGLEQRAGNENECWLTNWRTRPVSGIGCPSRKGSALFVRSFQATRCVRPRASNPSRGNPGGKIIVRFRLYKVSNALSFFYEWLSPPPATRGLISSQTCLIFHD
jgi:hypothetical protein